MDEGSYRFEMQVSRRELAELAGVRRETITTWAGRHSDFPRPRAFGAQEYLYLPSVLAWLERRPIPLKSLRDGEVEGATYAERIRRALRRRPPATGRTEPGRTEPGDDGQTGRTLTELYGPLADRVRGAGSRSAYLYLLLSLVSVRGADRRAWGRIRDLVVDADRQQQDPRAALRSLGVLIDDVLRGQGQIPGAVALFDTLRPEASDDLAYVVRLCDGLGREAFQLLLDRFEELTNPGSTEFFTPRGLTRLMAEMLCADYDGRPRCYDPYVRGGEGLSAMVERLGDAPVLGESPHLTALRLAGMNLAFHGVRPVLKESTATPWDRPERPGPVFDRVITNPPFNQKVPVPRDRSRQRWPFGPPPERSDTYAWLQYAYASLAPGGRAAVVMPNRAAVTDDARERAIRGQMIEKGAVKCVVWLPRGLFPGTPIAVTVWVLAASDAVGDQVLLIDARMLGRKEGKRHSLSQAEWNAIAACYERWVRGEGAFAEPLEGAGGAAVSVPAETIRGREDSLDPSEYAEVPAERNGPETSVPWPDVVLDDVRRRTASADSVVGTLRVRERDAQAGGLPGGWRKVPLAELCDIQTGPTHSRLKAAPRSPGGVPVIVRGHLRDRRLVVADADRLAPQAARRLGRFALEPDDLLCVRTGSTGPLALVGAEWTGCVFGSGLTRIRCSPPAELDPGYLLAFLSLPASQNWIGNRAATATAIDSIGGKRLGHLLVTLPPLGEQRRIGAVLRAMDDQIAAHRDFAEAAERTRSALATDLISGPLALD
ncbi:type I restriction-modification system subunit M/S [Actinomadura sp. K4S16]|uniref:type I restriction-modification system subunit M/S n=1 Tax=Actinomadura sp. K4S16 TaxID=1316147 RepID=UPI0011F065A7|nr:type I restriction-modification system subunit M/S [Actinomadura sp. K4S16]